MLIRKKCAPPHGLQMNLNWILESCSLSLTLWTVWGLLLVAASPPPTSYVDLDDLSNELDRPGELFLHFIAF